ncbi:Chromo-like domain superfamily [Sesbania bispinosa]|nr:Chromo-like domain superfamily [Sesbania bispinosa]
MKVLDKRVIRRNSTEIQQVLVHWQSTEPNEATWEDLDDFQQAYPQFNLEDKVAVKGVPCLEYPEELNIVIGKQLLFKVEVRDDRAFKFDDSFKSKFKAPMSELFDGENPAEETANATDSLPLVDLYNDVEITPIIVGECSNVAACLALHKRMTTSRVNRASAPKRRVRGSQSKWRRIRGT